MPDVSTQEHIVLNRRKHWFVLVAELLGPIILALLPFLIYPYLEGREFLVGAQNITVTASPALLTYLASIWLLIFWMRIVGVWMDYYLDVWTVTSKHIQSREQKGFFHRRTSVFQLDRIQDITIETRGFIPTLLHFGDIHVQTAGEQQEFIMRGIANPKYVREVILTTQVQVHETKEGL